MYRLKDKNGDMRDSELWNIVCDALINANLKRDGIKIPDDRICSNTDEEYGEWVLQYNCEELYEMKKREKEEQQKKEQESKNSQNQDNDNSEQTENQNSNEGKKQGDDHSLWAEAFKQQQMKNSKEKEKRQNQINKSNSQEQQSQEREQIEEQESMNFDEKEEFEENRKEKIERFKSRREKTQQNIRNDNKETIEFGDIGESKEEIDWRILTRREIEKSEDIWSQRRSIAENNFAYRLE